jgi:hypothetical protein
MLYFLRLLCKILYQNLTVECLGHMVYLLPKLKKYIRPRAPWSASDYPFGFFKFAPINKEIWIRLLANKVHPTNYVECAYTG